MEAIFLKVLNMSIAAGWMILAVMLVRVLLKKAPKAFHCVLWALVAIRLVCPISLESVWSLIPSKETIPQETMYAVSPTINSGISVINKAINPVMSESLAPTPGASVNPIQVQLYLASIVWGIGIAVMFAYLVISYIRLHKKVRFSIRLKDNIWICDEIDSPFILGVIKPKIYLPSSLQESHRTAVLAHEYAHIKRRDHWWKPIGFLLLTVYWFNPLIWGAYILLCRDIELACDERVIKDMDVQEKKDYSKALLSCSVSRKMVTACPLAFGEVGVKARIRSVLNYKKPGFWIFMIAVVASVVFAVCFLTNPKDAKTLNIGTASAMIEESCGMEVDVYTLDDSVPGYIFAGYTSDSRTGIAYFRYDDIQQGYILCGCEENYPEYPFGITVGEEIGLEHSVTIAAGIQDEIAFIQMAYEGDVHEAGVSVYPILVTYEWEQLFTEQDETDIQIRFYDKDRVELDYSGPMVPHHQNPDGTWTADGKTYQYRLILRGTSPNAVRESAFTVLTNNLDVTFEQVSKSLYSSQSDDWLDMTETRIVDLGVGEFVTGSANDFRPFDEVKQMLAGYPDDLDKLGSAECYVVLHGAPRSGEEYWESFYNAVCSGVPAEIVLVQYTIEGDPVLDYIQYNGESFYHVHDSSRDAYAGSNLYTEQSAPYLKVFDTEQENGDICRYIFLTNQQDLTLEDTFEYYASSSIREDILLKQVLYAVLGNVYAEVPEGVAYHQVETSFDESDVLIEEVAQIEVVNGSTGEPVMIYPGDEMFEKIMVCYKKLDFMPTEESEENLWRNGYKYYIHIYDHAGQMVQSVIPYTDTVQIDGKIYDASMNGTSVELILQLEEVFG